MQKELFTNANINEIFKNMDLDTTEKRSKYANMGTFATANSTKQNRQNRLPSFSLSHKTGMSTGNEEV